MTAGGRHQRQRRRGRVHHDRRTWSSPRRSCAPRRRTPRPTSASTDVWEDLRYAAEGVRCFPSNRADAGRRAAARLRRSLAGTVVRLSLDAQAEGIGVDPRNPPLAWEVWNGEGWIGCARLRGHHRRAEPGRRGHPARPDRARDAHRRQRRGVLAAGAAARSARRQADLPGLAADPRRPGRVARRDVAAEHCRAWSASEVIGRSDGAPGQVFAVAHRPVLARRRDGETVLVDDDGRHARPGPRSTTSARPGRPTSTSCGTARAARCASARGCATRTASVRQHGAIPRDGATIPVTGYRHGGGARGNVGARTLTVMRRSIPFVQRRDQPGAGDRRRRRRDRDRGEDPRPDDAAHRPARGHRRRLRAAHAGVVDRGGPGPLPARRPRQRLGAAARRAAGARRRDPAPARRLRDRRSR